MSGRDEPHPWQEFLEARLRLIDRLAMEGRTPQDIAWAMNLDADQVALLLLITISQRERP